MFDSYDHTVFEGQQYNLPYQEESISYRIWSNYILYSSENVFVLSNSTFQIFNQQKN